MFHYAEEKADGYQSIVYSQLENAIDSLEKTASTWFNGSSESVKTRRQQLSQAQGLAMRTASLLDEEDGAEVRVLASALSSQEKELSVFQKDVADQEYSQRVGNTDIRFSEPLSDESRTAARAETDWNVFLAIEPREFVASNLDADEDEIKIRAFSYMDVATSGHGLGRAAKRQLTETFIARSLDEIKKNVRPTEKVAAISSYDDAALFF